MASVYKTNILTGATTVASVNSPAVALQPPDKDFAAVISCPAFTSGTIAAKLQHSHDGVTWFDLVSFTSITGTGSELKSIASPVLKNIRAVTSGGIGNVVIDLCFGE